LRVIPGLRVGLFDPSITDASEAEIVFGLGNAAGLFEPLPAEDAASDHCAGRSADHAADQTSRRAAVLFKMLHKTAAAGVAFLAAAETAAAHAGDF
jgi:hypothetical protein